MSLCVIHDLLNAKVQQQFSCKTTWNLNTWDSAETTKPTVTNFEIAKKTWWWKVPHVSVSRESLPLYLKECGPNWKVKIVSADTNLIVALETIVKTNFSFVNRYRHCSIVKRLHDIKKTTKLKEKKFLAIMFCCKRFLDNIKPLAPLRCISFQKSQASSCLNQKTI